MPELLSRERMEAVLAEISALPTEQRQAEVKKLKELTDDDVCAETAKRVRATVANSPEVRLLYEHLDEHGPRVGYEPLRTVQDAIAHKAMWALKLAESRQTHLCFSSVFMLWAVPYVWGRDMFEAVTASASDIPRHTIEAKLPHPAVWFTLSDATWVNIYSKDEWFDGFLALQLPDGIRICPLGRNDKAEELISWPVDLKTGSIFPDDYPQASARDLVAQFLSCLSFINSPYIVLAKQPLPRAVRRRIGAPELTDANTATFILLRSPLRKDEHEHNDNHVDWKHRWLVRGHHRAQWCPGSQTHRLIWIAPYVKGPEDAPLKVRAYKVAR